ncbi:hypothetical protein SCLCIDRAFT_16142 [Scleroderma citrinum Foug A]|uniref:Uncharacterized protein n=1 Tax=Scleroderma citrinum Foug A TaxID=1036808 RepID=A0A0C3A937_9AGAM|nr:hypothetical protein SCLCIDRAFT_16142 [Scleroderma citrinum Foug A]
MDAGIRDPWGCLTRQQVYDCLPLGTLPGNIGSWAKLAPAIRRLPSELQVHIRDVAAVKEIDWCKKKPGDFLVLPTKEQHRACIAAFIDAIGNEALSHGVCIVCARELTGSEGQVEDIYNIPNAQHLLEPKCEHDAYDLWQGLNVLRLKIDEKGKGWVCHEWRLPKLALNNNMWLGEPPLVLWKLTFVETLLIARHYARCYVFKLYPKDGSQGYRPSHLQHAMASNIMLYEVNTSTIASMLEGVLLPQSVNMLSSIVAITFIGTQKLPIDWLSHTFRVCRDAVHEVLQWLHEHNILYRDIVISSERLLLLPENKIPQEIEAAMCYEEDGSMVMKEKDGYVMEELPMENVIWSSTVDMHSPGSDVIPLHVLGVTDMDLSKVSSSELMAHALVNFNDGLQEGGYTVRHSMLPINDFGKNTNLSGASNPLAAAFPILFPYGVSRVEAEHETKVSLRDHARWAMQYYNRRFTTHHTFPFVVFTLMQKQEALKDFDQEGLGISLITLNDLKIAEGEEGRKEPISNSRMQALHKHVVATNIVGSDNVPDIHDPIAQVFAGESIDLDQFNSFLGPDSQRHAENIALNPYAAARFFDFIICAMLQTLMGIQCHGSRVTSDMGILGEVTAYFSVVEAQGQGTLHLHMLMWVAGTPDTHLDDLMETDIQKMARNPQLAYTHPPDPWQDGWVEQNHELEWQLVCSQQVHTCSRSTCLKLQKGCLTCKRRVPWPLSNEDYVDVCGNWNPKRMNSYINGYCPSILTTMCCNNDIKINTNGRDMKDIMIPHQQTQGNSIVAIVVIDPIEKP